jgi:hypothetical protein
MTAQLITSPSLKDLQAAWRSIGPGSCPHTYNFHMHTRCSDGQLTPQEVVQQAVEIGLKGFAITDHHTLQGYRIAANLLPADGPTLWTGIEINGDLEGCEIHILGYGFDPDRSALRPYTKGCVAVGQAYSAANAIAAIHAAGGLAILAHPFRYDRTLERLVADAVACGIDGLEAYYNYRNPSPWVPSPEKTDRALDLAQQYGLHVTCGTDTHGPSLLKRL